MSKENDWLYGINPIKEALKSGRKINSIYISKSRRADVNEIVNIAQNKKILINFTETDFFNSKFPKGHQGIAAKVERKKLFSLDELLKIPSQKHELPFFIILDCIEDPHNFGSIIRVAEAVKVHGIIYQSRRSVGINSIVSKTSAGAIEYVNLSQVINIKHAIEKIKKIDIKVIGADANSEKTIWTEDMATPLALVVGSENKGIRKTVSQMCDSLVKIPMKGSINSLNVSTATAIFCYEILRQRNS
ncbi:MAG: 23S rRNA (guanosine(2251)-2'-O)-methyltransferase RlmB [Thermodesulfovibrionales bacterium]|nr:23S rRNA (guanosine(2251)-2'-O)-methyltransferase RlmB [Thermodesulfovibrionales bacterium]